MSWLIQADGDNPAQIKMPPIRVRWVRGENGEAAWVIDIPLATQGNGQRNIDFSFREVLIVQNYSLVICCKGVYVLLQIGCFLEVVMPAQTQITEILKKRFEALVNLRDENGSKVLLEGNNNGVPTLFIRVARLSILYQALDINPKEKKASIEMAIIRKLRALGFENVLSTESIWLQSNKITQIKLAKTRGEKHGGKYGTERILVGHGDCPITIDSYRELILDKLQVALWSKPPQDMSPIAEILAKELTLRNQLKAHWTSHSFPIEGPQFLRSYHALEIHSSNLPNLNPQPPASHRLLPQTQSLMDELNEFMIFNVHPSGQQQQMQQARLLSHNQHFQRPAGQSASGSQPGSSGFNPQFQPSNVSTGDQPGTSGLSRTQAGSPIRHQGQQQHTQPAQVSGATSFQRTTHPRPAPYFPAQPHVDRYPQYYPTYQEDDGYLHVYDPKTGRFPKRS
ncbi:hypothetical protein Xbed_03222 [Xenorhabdus beddingii]|uniref:Uncharacterized protein n=2 Tax=Xenorhabdus beddingii TaxID=40578 RepID=A0A1Y2SJG6_9GAMM|nr:hypothetical protein Xbed_03222 [Xenorhabdus beddingii]